MAYEESDTAYDNKQAEAERCLEMSRGELDSARDSLAMCLRHVLPDKVSEKRFDSLIDCYGYYGANFKNYSAAYVEARLGSYRSAIDLMEGMHEATVAETERRRAVINFDLNRMDIISRIGQVFGGSVWIGSNGPQRREAPVLTIPFEKNEVMEEWRRQTELRQGCGLDLEDLVIGTATGVTAELLAGERSIINDRYSLLHGEELGLTAAPQYVDMY